MRDLEAPSPLLVAASTIAGILSVQLAMEHGHKPPPNVYSGMILCVIDLAVAAGLDPIALRDKTREILKNPEGAMDEARRGMDCANQFPS